MNRFIGKSFSASISNYKAEYLNFCKVLETTLTNSTFSPITKNNEIDENGGIELKGDSNETDQFKRICARIDSIVLANEFVDFAEQRYEIFEVYRDSKYEPELIDGHDLLTTTVDREAEALGTLARNKHFLRTKNIMIELSKNSENKIVFPLTKCAENIIASKVDLDILNFMVKYTLANDLESNDSKNKNTN